MRTRGPSRTVGTALLLVTTGLLGLVASCAPGTNADDLTTPAYVKPAWMAEELQYADESQAHQESCLTANGIAFEAQPNGGFSFPGSADMDAVSALLDECTREFVGDGYGDLPTPEQLKSLYRQNLDVIECLKNEGFELEEPMSEEAFIDSGGAWAVHSSLPADADLTRLARECPEPLGLYSV